MTRPARKQIDPWSSLASRWRAPADDAALKLGPGKIKPILDKPAGGRPAPLRITSAGMNAHDEAMAFDEKLALDRAPTRSYDVDGRLHVAPTPISKATVNPYLGGEIPDFEKFGLDPKKIYKLLRDPKELEKAAPTFNNLPVLSKHVPVSADDWQPELVIGSTGTDAAFAAPYLNNSLVIWARNSIEDVESDVKKEISCGYRYRPDMTPGTFEGTAYDGVMRDIVGNHVAIVKEGRAGPDVVIGDSKEILNMKTVPLTRKAILAQGAVVAFLAPRLALDAKVDLTPAFVGITAKNYGEKIPTMVARVSQIARGKLAADASVEGLSTLLEALAPIKPAEAQADKGAKMDHTDEERDTLPGEGANEKVDETAYDSDDPVDQIKAFLKGKLDPEDMQQLEALIAQCAKGGAPAEDGDDEGEGGQSDMMNSAMNGDDPPPFTGKPVKPGAQAKEPVVTKTAMDAAIAAAIESTRKAGREVEEARNFVRPYVGEIRLALDSAPAIYRQALKMRGIDPGKVQDPEALRMLIKSASAAPRAAIAQDAAANDSFSAMFKDTARIGVA